MSNDFNSEALSALMDDELSSFEVRRLLNKLSQSSSDEPHQQTLSAQWMRWHVAQDALHDQAGTCSLNNDFCQRVSEAIASEPMPAIKLNVWRSSATRIAVAASVALAMVGGWQLWQNDSSNGAVPTVAKNQTNSVATTVAYPLFTQSRQETTYNVPVVRPVVEVFSVPSDSSLAQMLENSNTNKQQSTQADKSPLMLHRR